MPHLGYGFKNCCLSKCCLIDAGALPPKRWRVSNGCPVGSWGGTLVAEGLFAPRGRGCSKPGELGSPGSTGFSPHINSRIHQPEPPRWVWGCQEPRGEPSQRVPAAASTGFCGDTGKGRACPCPTAASIKLGRQLCLLELLTVSVGAGQGPGPHQGAWAWL